MVVLDGNFALVCGLPLNTCISMYARTKGCYKDRGPRKNYVRSSLPHCIYNNLWYTFI